MPASSSPLCRYFRHPDITTPLSHVFIATMMIFAADADAARRKMPDGLMPYATPLVRVAAQRAKEQRKSKRVRARVYAAMPPLMPRPITLPMPLMPIATPPSIYFLPMTFRLFSLMPQRC